MKYLWWRMLLRILWNPSTFRTLAYSESKAYSECCHETSHSNPCVTLAYLRSLIYSQLWYILKSKHIQNAVKYLRWNTSLKTLCNYWKFRRPIYSKLSYIQNPNVSAASEFISYSLELTIWLLWLALSNLISSIKGASIKKLLSRLVDFDC